MIAIEGERVTATDLKLPTFLIIGANKAGTTSLYHYLRQHPGVFMSAVKEPMFFTAIGDANLKGSFANATLANPVAATSLEEYAQLFEGSGREQARGEASTSYLANPQCAHRILEFLPSVRLIAVLRNPIERAYSNFMMYWGNGLEQRSFDECARDEAAGRNCDLPQGRWYLRLGLYGAAIEQFQRVFGREPLLALSYEDLGRDPLDVYRRILRHIGADDAFVPDLSTRFNRREEHAGGKVRERMSDHTRAFLCEFYRDDVRRLASLVEFDPMQWLADRPDSPTSGNGPVVAVAR